MARTNKQDVEKELEKTRQRLEQTQGQVTDLQDELGSQAMMVASLQERLDVALEGEIAAWASYEREVLESDRYFAQAKELTDTVFELGESLAFAYNVVVMLDQSASNLQRVRSIIMMALNELDPNSFDHEEVVARQLTEDEAVHIAENFEDEISNNETPSASVLCSCASCSAATAMRSDLPQPQIRSVLPS